MKNKSIIKMVLILLCLSCFAICFTVLIDFTISSVCRVTVSGNRVCNLFAQHYDIDGDSLYFGLSSVNRLMIYIVTFSILLLAQKNRSFVYSNKIKALVWIILGVIILDFSYSIFRNKIYKLSNSNAYIVSVANQWVIDCKKNIFYTPYFVYDPNLKVSNNKKLNSFDICIMNYNENRSFNIFGKDISGRN